MRLLPGALLGALFVGINAHAAHDLVIAKGYFDSIDSVPWEVATARADIRSKDRDLPGAVFVAVTTASGGMMVFTTNGWKPFSGGLLMPAATFDHLPDAHSIVVFNSRDTYLRRKRLPETSLSGQTLCQAAEKLGADGFAMAVGYGVLTQDAEEQIERMRSLGSGIDLDHMRLAFVNRDMTKHKKWREVYRVDCTPDDSAAN